MAGAMGVRRRFYAAFATFLAENGVSTLTFDYRGVGGSRPPGRLSRFRAELHEWGEEDLAGAIDFASTWYPGVPLVLVGHSVGGQLVGLAHNAEKVAAMLFVSAQSGYWRLWPLPWRWQIVLVWHLSIPALTRTLGYLPLSLLGGGADVPAGVALEWGALGPASPLHHELGRGASPRALPLDRLPLARPGHRRRPILCATSRRRGARRDVSEDPVGGSGDHAGRNQRPQNRPLPFLQGDPP